MAHAKRELALAIALLILAGTAAAETGTRVPEAAASAAAGLPLAGVSQGPAGLALQPLIPFDFGLLVVAGAEGTVARQPLAAGESILFAPLDDLGQPLADGVYRWELRLVTEPSEEIARASKEARERGDLAAWRQLRSRVAPQLQRVWGTMTVLGGIVDTTTASDGNGNQAGGDPDITISNADPRLTFDDTTPEDNYYIEADADVLTITNETTAEDIVTFASTTSPFENGVVGLFTTTPDHEVELHVVDGLPEIRLDATSGVWDLRAITNDFQILDSAPFFPVTVLEVEKTGSNYELVFMGGGTFEGDFAAGSSRDLKRDLEAAPGAELLERLRELPLYSWSYIRDPEGVRHLGPIAEDFHEAFGLGRDNKHISPTDSAGLALAAIQALADQLETRDREIAELRTRLEALETNSNPPGPAMP